MQPMRGRLVWQKRKCFVRFVVRTLLARSVKTTRRLLNEPCRRFTTRSGDTHRASSSRRRKRASDSVTRLSVCSCKKDCKRNSPASCRQDLAGNTRLMTLMSVLLQSPLCQLPHGPPAACRGRQVHRGLPRHLQSVLMQQLWRQLRVIVIEQRIVQRHSTEMQVVLSPRLKDCVGCRMKRCSRNSRRSRSANKSVSCCWSKPHRVTTEIAWHRSYLWSAAKQMTP
mmetsp:Transcript_33588/g.55497  ORF Transcript_33588/g.55497 Transcript_33588/m.55497 type:complete len:225 (-) Transcript_33588:192-866(-)